MKTLKQLEAEFKKLEKEYRANPLPYGKEYKSFVRRWKSLESKIRNYNNATNRMKRAGLKTTKTNIGYKVEYKGIVAEVFLTGCVTDYWEVYVIKGDIILDFDNYRTKTDAIWSLFSAIDDLKN